MYEWKRHSFDGKILQVDAKIIFNKIWIKDGEKQFQTNPLWPDDIKQN
jgi:hypothetical protein